jgi:hypothetical protein
MCKAPRLQCLLKETPSETLTRGFAPFESDGRSSEAAEFIKPQAKGSVTPQDAERFNEIADAEVPALHEGNIARCRFSLPSSRGGVKRGRTAGKGEMSRRLAPLPPSRVRAYMERSQGSLSRATNKAPGAEAKALAFRL